MTYQSVMTQWFAAMVASKSSSRHCKQFLDSVNYAVRSELAHACLEPMLANHSHLMCEDEPSVFVKPIAKTM